MAVDQKAYRRYHTTIERALTLFDVNSDWADYIAFLSRLLKALETGRPDGLVDVPCRAKVALSLSRCLQPHLPSGVHQKALDVYTEVFSIIGSVGLTRDLSLYLPGLSHTLAFANLATRPLVLDLYEQYILKLEPRTLRPALKALILSLLPVIEEESSEDFDRCLRIFDALRKAFLAEGEESFFWQTLFIASISNPQRRAGVLVYLSHFLPKLSPTVEVKSNGTTDPDVKEGVDVVTTPEPGLLVRCFATGLRDEQPLVQRGFLDLLVTHLPLNAGILQKEMYQKDLDVLVTAAMMIVLRRDMGLNRRLWAWYTGSDGKESAQVISSTEQSDRQLGKEDTYFATFGLEATVRSIKSLLQTTTTQPAPRTLPFRIGLSLMDRWEIGGPVVRRSLTPMMSHLMSYQSSAPTQDAFDEVYRSASSFFDGIESIALYDCLTALVTANEIDLITFIATNFNLEQVDLARKYLYQLSSMIASKILQQDKDQFPWIMLLSTLLSTIPPPIAASKPPDRIVVDSLLRDISQNISSVLSDNGDIALLPGICICFEQALLMCESAKPVLETRLLETLQSSLLQWHSDSTDAFTSLETSTRILTSLLQRRSLLSDTAEDVCLDCLPMTIKHLWVFLHTSTPQYHVVTVEHLWRLHNATSDHEIVESTVLHLLSSATGPSMRLTSNQVERYSVLFHHMKQLKRSSEDLVPQVLQQASLKVLDNTTGKQRSEPGVHWLLSLQSISPMVGLVLDTQFGDIQTVTLTLHRIKKLLNILSLSEDHWRSFSTSSDLPTVRSFAISVVQRSAADFSILSHDAFLLLRMLYDNRSGNVCPEEMVSMLVDMLGDSTGKTEQQDEVLDTLLAVLNDRNVLPASLVGVLLQGVSSVPIDDRLDKWITLLCNVLPNHAALLPNLLKTTSSFCTRIEEAFEDIKSVFSNGKRVASSHSPERSITNLLSGLEYILARSHQQIMQSAATSGTSNDSVSNRSQANDRLTVILCMQDAARVCTKLWSWKAVPRADGQESSKTITGDVKSFQYSAIKLRSRSRKILENLIEAEPQECLETLIGMWTTSEQSQVLELLQTLNGARPRSMMPAVFNAIHSRSSAANMKATKMSTLSIQTNPLELMTFLNDYTSALEDDMLEEIWVDCANFTRDVLANPMPYRQILIKLLRFCSLLSQKMENTNFSEESRMYRELADICARLFTAMFTIKPSGIDIFGTSGESKSKLAQAKNAPKSPEDDNMLAALVDTLPVLSPLMGQSDRLNTVYTGIATNITTPSLHARAFPSNITLEHLEVLRIMATSAGAVKTWRKDLIDSFYNPRFFQSSIELAKKGWLPLIRQLQVNDKTALTECLARIAPPAAAGLMFGVGASAARNEADKKTQLELRRITTLLMSGEIDACLPQLPQILQKVEELFGATIESSPSLATRGDTYLLIRALFFKVSHSNLYLLWPVLDQELQELCKDILAGSESKYSDSSKIQGAKLLDILLLMRPDEFQLHEWLFITDTIDAIYPSTDVSPSSFAEEIAPVLSSHGTHYEPQTPLGSTVRKPWLYESDAAETQDVNALLAGFFGQLSIRAFEDLYSLQPLDEEACREDVLADTFSGGGITI